MTKLEERIRSGLRETAERIPDTATRLREAKSKPLRPVWITVAAGLGVLVVFSPVFLLDGSDPVSAPEEPTITSTAVPASTTPSVEPEPGYRDRFPVVVEVKETGDLIGLERGHAFRSTNGGESWREIIAPSGADLIDVAPDGTVIAVGNSEEREMGIFGPNTWVREAPVVQILDPLAVDWKKVELPRPEFPVDDPKPAPLDGSGGCGLAGIHWTWDALSLAISDRYVIAGEQRIVEETLCDESFQFFWTSQDGETWTITEPTGIPGYMTGITWFDGRYIAYGSELPWYWSVQSKTLQIWTSPDLANWETADIDLSLLPPNSYPEIFPDEEASISPTVVSTITDGVLRLNVPIGLAAPSPDASIENVDELAQWAEANRRGSYSTEDLQATLESMNVAFPLDQEELQKLTNFFFSTEGFGRLILETDDGTTWTRQYEDH